jgi:hypothetical protein
MTEQTPATPARPAARRRPSLYRTVLSLGIAAIAATWLPFSFLYINALSKRAATVTATRTLQAPSATAALHASNTGAAPAATTLAAVTTRTS